MTSITSDILSSRADRPAAPSVSFAELRNLWRRFFALAFNPYRPELHYMRGPGPAWHAKHRAVSPAVQSLLAEIRAAKALKPTTR